MASDEDQPADLLDDSETMSVTHISLSYDIFLTRHTPDSPVTAFKNVPPNSPGVLSPVILRIMPFDLTSIVEGVALSREIA